MADDLIDRVANDLAAGRAVDWPAAIAAARSAEERGQLESLRQVQEIVRRLQSPGQPEAPNLNEATTIQPATPSVAVAETTAVGAWGRYQLVEEVGVGSYGSVYRALDPALNVDIAIKILHRQVDDNLLKERLLAEGRALAKVRHQNVVRVLGVEFNGVRAGLCTEFIYGETLEREVRARGTFSQAQAVEVGTAICQALAAVHRAGFLHRDVKARNTMRERDTGRIVLMDFGTGRDLQEELASTKIGIDGTAIYMAPEVLDGQPASHSSDVYSVGVLLYYVLTAAYPVEGGSLADLRAAHRDGLRTPLGDRRPDLSPSFIRVIERALAPKQKRYATPGALCEELEKTSIDRRAVWLKRLVVSATAFAATLGAVTLLGFITTMYLNSVLELKGFVDDGFVQWLKWGAISTLAPLFNVIAVLFAFTVILECNRLLTRVSTKVRDIERSGALLMHRCSLDDVTMLSSLSLIASGIALLGTCWYFAPLLRTLYDIRWGLSTVSADRLTLLSPDFQSYQLSYRKVFSLTSIACVILWYPVVRLAIRTRRLVPRRTALAGVVILVLSLVLLDFPYRLLSHDIDFDQVKWSGRSCHLLGRRGDDRLIFCPDLPAPRTRAVPASTIVADPPPVGDNEPTPGTQEAKRKRSIFKFLIKQDRRAVG